MLARHVRELSRAAPPRAAPRAPSLPRSRRGPRAPRPPRARPYHSRWALSVYGPEPGRPGTSSGTRRSSRSSSATRTSSAAGWRTRRRRDARRRRRLPRRSLALHRRRPRDERRRRTTMGPRARRRRRPARVGHRRERRRRGDRRASPFRGERVRLERVRPGNHPPRRRRRARRPGGRLVLRVHRPSPPRLIPRRHAPVTSRTSPSARSASSAPRTRSSRRTRAHGAPPAPLRHRDARRLVSYHAHNLRARRDGVINRLRSGGALALVSDAGPRGRGPGRGPRRACAEEGLAVVPVPGPCAPRRPSRRRPVGVRDERGGPAGERQREDGTIVVGLFGLLGRRRGR